MGSEEAVDVGVQHADGVAGLRQGDGQIDRDRRLTDPALTRGDAEHPGLGEPVEKAGRGVGVIAMSGAVGRHGPAQEVAQRQTLVVVHGANDDLGPRGSLCDALAQRLEVGPVDHREHQLDAWNAVNVADVAQESQFAQRSYQLRFADGGEVTSKFGVKRHGRPLLSLLRLPAPKSATPVNSKM